MMLMFLTTLTLAAEPCHVIREATVHAPDGPHAGWDVAWSGDRLTAVGPDLDVDCTEHRAPGGVTWQVTPGLVATNTHTGLVEIELESSTRDDDRGGDDPVRASLRVADAYNPLSNVVRVTRMGGVTSAVIVPSGGLVHGQAGFVSLHGTTQADTVVSPTVAVTANLTALGNRAAALAMLRELLQDAADASDQRDGYKPRSYAASRLDLQVLAKVGRGELPLVVRADRAPDIEALIRFADQTKVNLVIHGAAEGWMLAEQLAEAEIPCIVDPLVYGAGSVDQLHGRADNAALLHAAGVLVILSDGESHNARTVRFLAGNAVRGGLPHAAALAAVTSTPATVFGQSDRGKLEAGAIADIAVWTGDPLDVPGRLSTLVIEGELVTLGSRQTELVEAYRKEGNKPLLP